VIIRVFKLASLPPPARRPRSIAGVCRRVLRDERADAQGEINVVFLDRRRMRLLNRRYLGHEHDTDVIAFRYAEDPGPVPGEHPFGDIFISTYQAKAQAKELGHTVLTEVMTLAAHGTLHLLGYDDKTAQGRDRMFRKQKLAIRGRRKGGGR